MKIKFKKQEFQTRAVDSIVNVFTGQPFLSNERKIADFKRKTTLLNYSENKIVDDYDISFSNPEIILNDRQLLDNINAVQKDNGVTLSKKLSKEHGSVDLDIDMETGTGKTYVYIKSIYELNRLYGMTKFIIVVPSIAIREGVKKSFEMTVDHFMNDYGKKIRFFVYNSLRLNDIEAFASSDSIQVMIINVQAFNARDRDSRKIYEELDRFQSRRPIDVLAKTKPILILDEPQKMSGAATKESLKRFKPLFSMNFSATHREEHNLIYVLDAVDAYNKKIVKKIEVKGFNVKNLRGVNSFLYLEDILISNTKAPEAKIMFEINYKTKSINRESRLLKTGDNLYKRSNNLEQYRDGYTISEIDPLEGKVRFLNGVELKIGEATGDVQDNDIRRIQIRETIKSHLEKEEFLFDLGIKVLSLFFIDEVAKYRLYDEFGNEETGIYGAYFEEEYNSLVNEYLNNSNSGYSNYLRNIDATETHRGYFSIDRKNRMIDSKIKRGHEVSDDISAYDLILKNKEKLLSFEEPTRFIFSHSALREGWDNPNIFQICTLRHTKSSIQKHQEVGRGLRLSVNKFGERIDSDYEGLDVHDINKLTVVANESYEDFVTGLQKEVSETLYMRDLFLTPEFFKGKKITTNNNDETVITSKQSLDIYRYLLSNDYINEENILTENFIMDFEKEKLPLLNNELLEFSNSIINLILKTKDSYNTNTMYEDGYKTRIVENKLNDNFYKKEFQQLWNLINRKYVYSISFDSNELIRKSVKSIDENLYVSRVLYTVTVAEQKDNLDRVDYEGKTTFKSVKTRTEALDTNNTDNIKYDIIGKISESTNLKRLTIAEILNDISSDKFSMFKNNPEEFINKVSNLINNEKASMTIEHIEYDEIEGTYDSSIFFETKTKLDFRNAFKSKKHIKDYVFTDGTSSKSIERVFAENLEGADEVAVYAKLPRSFYIPTPVGNYSPDWAITFYDQGVKHIYFIAETKGTMESIQLRKIEEYKIKCATRLFEKLSSENLVYSKVDSYMELMSILK